MWRMHSEAPRGLRWGTISLAALVAVTAVLNDTADARSRRKRGGYHRVSHAHHHHRTPHALRRPTPTTNTSRYAAIVVDGNSGKVLHAANADALRHPASLTKIMTLYMLFERLESGKIKLDTPLQISEHASRQAPTKLGLRAGSTIAVEDAIKGMVTRSANDAAVVVAENLGGSEAEFGRMMTRKAQSLGMSRTVYANASGLPNPDQVTTAHDQSILGRAIQERFPNYYRYFSIRSFSYRGQSIGNHNRLLGRVEGVDGIKTGYTQASGFNLVTSVHRSNRYIVAVVLGGASAGSRDARMRELITQHIETGATRRSAPAIVEWASKEEVKAVAQVEPRAAPATLPTPAPAPRSVDRIQLAGTSVPVRIDPAPPAAITMSREGPAPGPVPGSADPIRPVAVKTLQVKPPTSARPPAPTPMHTASVVPVPMGRLAAAQEAPREPAPPAPRLQTQTHGGWLIQVGAFPAEEEAKQRLASVQSKAARLLGSADPFTETATRDDKTFYRARFAGLDRERAEAVCNFLKRNNVECLPIRN